MNAGNKTKNVTTSMVGLKRWSHTQKPPKMVNPRDTALNTEEEEKNHTGKLTKWVDLCEDSGWLEVYKKNQRNAEQDGHRQILSPHFVKRAGACIIGAGWRVVIRWTQHCNHSRFVLQSRLMHTAVNMAFKQKTLATAYTSTKGAYLATNVFSKEGTFAEG